MLALDSNLFIYLLDGNEQFLQKSKKWLNVAKFSETCISTLVITEALSKVGKTDFKNALFFLESLCKESSVKVVPIDRSVAIKAAEIRGQANVSTADALHLASAICSGATRFITNDLKLVGKKFDQLRVEAL